MESIRQGADNNSKSFQANGLLQSHLDYNTPRKIIGEIVWGAENLWFSREKRSGTIGRTASNRKAAASQPQALCTNRC